MPSFATSFSAYSLLSLACGFRFGRLCFARRCVIARCYSIYVCVGKWRPSAQTCSIQWCLSSLCGARPFVAVGLLSEPTGRRGMATDARPREAVGIRSL